MLLASWQAPCLAFVRPAQWLGQWHGLCSAKVEYRVGASPVEVLQAFEDVIADEPGLFQLRSLAHSTQSVAFTLYCFTKCLRWLDVVEVRACAENTDTVVHAQSLSTGFFPAVFPFCVLLNIAYAPLPFFDHGANLSRLERFRTHLEQTLHKPVEIKVLAGGAKVNGWGLVFVLFVTACTMVVTVWNILYNPDDNVALALTLITAALTLHSVVTLFNAVLVCYRERSEPGLLTAV